MTIAPNCWRIGRGTNIDHTCCAALGVQILMAICMQVLQPLFSYKTVAEAFGHIPTKVRAVRVVKHYTPHWEATEARKRGRSLK